jgi:hypothetical protein
MWATLALMSAVSWTPAQAGQLELKNVRLTHGILGQERKDKAFLQGDLVVLAFDIEGLQTGADGTVKYSKSLELTNKKGEAFYKRAPQTMSTVNTLGGSRLPSFGLAEIGHDTPPGEYKMTIVVTDEAAKPPTKATLPFTFEVKPMKFSIIRPGFVLVSTNEADAGAAPQLAPPLAVPGQTMVVNFAVVGFDLKGDKQTADIAVSMEIQDEKGEPVLKKPFTGRATEIDENFKKLKMNPFFLPINVNRSGNFKVVLSAKDNHSGKTDKLTLDLKVLDMK